MTTFRVFADIHLHEWNDFATVRDGKNSRLLDQLEAVKRISDVPSSFGSKVDYCIIAGDLIHKRGDISPAVIWAVKDLISYLSEIYEHVIIIPGNHDFPQKVGDVSLNALVAVPDVENVSVYNSVETFQETTEFGTLAVHFVPWNPSASVMVEGFKRCADAARSGASKYNVLIGHCAIAGSKVSNGHIPPGGIPVSSLNADAFDFMAFGDFHTAQPITTNGVYVGAPYPMDRGDENLIGGALDFTVGNGGVFWTYLDDPAPLRIVRTTDFKQAKESKAAGHYVSFKAAGKVDSMKAIELGCAVEYIPAVAETTARVKADDVCNIEKLLDAYFKILSFNDFGGNSDIVKKLALDVYNKAVKDGAIDSSLPVKFLNIKQVHAENFLSYGRLSVDLDTRGLILLEGENKDDARADSNGAGKSALIESVYFGLFGDTLRGVPVGDLRRRGSKSPMIVKLLAEVDGVELIIERRRDGTKSNFVYTFNGEVGCHSNDPKQAQIQLNELMGWTPALFRQVVIFGQNVDFNFSVAKDSERKELLENLLPDASKFDVLYTMVRERITTEESKLSNLRVVRRPMLENDYLRGTETLQSLEAKRDSFEEEKRVRVEKLSADLKRYEDDIRESLDVISQTSEELREREAAVNDCQKNRMHENETLIEKLRIAESKAGELESTRDSLTWQISDANAEIRAASNSKVRFATLSGSCKHCGQDVEPEHVEKMVADLDATISEKTKLVEELTGKLKSVDVEISETNSAINAGNAAIRAADDKLRSAEYRLSETKSALESCEKNLESKQKLAQGVREVIAQEERHGNYFDEQISDCRSKLINLDREREALQAEEMKLAGAVELCGYVAKLYGNQGLKTFIFDSSIPEIMARANEALQLLTDGAITVEIKTERNKTGNEKIVFDVNNIYGGSHISAQSSGQRRKIDIALLWALNSLCSGRVNVKFIDEAFDALDSTAGAYVAKLLRKQREEIPTIINITHRSEFKTFFSRVWTAVLEGGETKLIERDSDDTDRD